MPGCRSYFASLSPYTAASTRDIGLTPRCLDLTTVSPAKLRLALEQLGCILGSSWSRVPLHLLGCNFDAMQICELRAFAAGRLTAAHLARFAKHLTFPACKRFFRVPSRTDVYRSRSSGTSSQRTYMHACYNKHVTVQINTAGAFMRTSAGTLRNNSLMTLAAYKWIILCRTSLRRRRFGIAVE